MHKEAEKKRVVPYKKKGKIYEYEIDWDKEFELEIQDIKNASDEIIKKDDSVLFQDEKFVEFCEKVMTDENGLQEYFNSDSDLYRTNFMLLLLKHGNFELVDEKILKNATSEQREQFISNLFDRINEIQVYIINENKYKEREIFTKNKPNNLELTYLNFLENFAPQMLDLATASRPVREDFLYLMDDLKKLTLDKYAIPNLFNKMVNFRNIYNLDTIIEILNIYDKFAKEKDESMKDKYTEQIDALCSRGIGLSGIDRGVVNLATVCCFETAGKLIDIIPSRIDFWKTDESLLSEDIDFIVSVIDKIDSIQLSPAFLLDMPIITKAMQLTDLKVLSENENKKLIDALDKALHKSELKTPDMSEYDKQISKRTPFDIETAEKFLNDCKILTIKEGIMPAKYNEYLIASILDETSALSQILDEKDRRLILENYARRRAKEMLGKPRYVTYSKNVVSKKTAAGEHSMGVMKIVPNLYDDSFIETVLNLVTINHELRHEWQNQNMDNSKFNRVTYMMTKDLVLRENLDRNFYKRNYERMYIEIDAEYFALRHTRNFLKTLNLTDFKSNPKYEIIMEELNKRIEEQEKNFTLAGEKSAEDGKYRSMDDILAELLKQKPELLKKYPVIGIEYNEDGSKKEDVDVTPNLDFDE